MTPESLCSVEGCDRRFYARTFCKVHYTASRRYSNPVRCSVEGCDKPSYCLTVCVMHYSRLKKTGEVGPAERKYAERGEGCHRPDGYRSVFIGGRNIMEHRWVMSQMLGRPLEPFENVHHINGVRDDNRPENLELWCKPQPNGVRVDDLVAWVVANYADRLP